MAQKRTIGVLSKQSGVKVTTIRYYESIGLIAEPDRSDSGQRIYDEGAIERLNFIHHTRDLGFPIEAIRDLIDLQEKPSNDCAVVDSIARRHLADVRERLSKLEALEAELKRMVSACEGGKIAACEVLSTLSNHDLCLDDHRRAESAGPAGRIL
jgi:DNA-binding transcriptional MerR regulator